MDEITGINENLEHIEKKYDLLLKQARSVGQQEERIWWTERLLAVLKDREDER